MKNEEKLIETLKDNLIYYRTLNGLTQVELANSIGYSDKSISKWERGEGVPDIIVLNKLASIYGVSLADLLNEKKVEVSNHSYKKRVIITILSALLPWLIASILFVLGRTVFLEFTKPWISFIYAIPCSAIVLVVFSKIWGDNLKTLLSLTLLYWSVPLSILLSFQFKNVYTLFYIAIPLQVISILWFILKKYK